MRKRTILNLFLFFFSLLLFSNCGGRSAEVQISAPLRPKYVAKGYRKIFIADFIVTGKHDYDKDVQINVNKEIKETLKSEFKDKSGYEIEDSKVEYSKDTPPEEILKNSEFWKALDLKEREGSIILAGHVEFSNRQKTGLVTERVQNPRTGDQRNLTTSRERLNLILAVNLFLIDAQTGEKLFQETFKEEESYDDVSNVSLPLFYDVFERMAPKIVGILVPYRVAGSRILLEP